MNKEEISEGNKLIAKFMGGKFTLIKSHTPNVSFKEHPRKDRNFNGSDMHPKLLSYHKSWDWLMPVVIKINEGFEYDVIIFRTTCHINDKEQIFVEANGGVKTPLIDVVYEAVVKFIKQYNEIKDKK